MPNEKIESTQPEFVAKYFGADANPADVILLRQAIENVQKGVMAQTKAAPDASKQKSANPITTAIKALRLDKPAPDTKQQKTLLHAVLDDLPVSDKDKKLIKALPDKDQVDVLYMIVDQARHGAVRVNLANLAALKRPDRGIDLANMLRNDASNQAAIAHMSEAHQSGMKAHPILSLLGGMALSQADLGLQVNAEAKQAEEQAKESAKAKKNQDKLQAELTPAPAPSLLHRLFAQPAPRSTTPKLKR